MKTPTNPSERAQTQSRVAQNPETLNLQERLGLNPREFGLANGKSATWAYRLIYAGKVKVISDAGRILIPAAEIARFFARATEYNPRTKQNAPISSKQKELTQ